MSELRECNCYDPENCTIVPDNVICKRQCWLGLGTRALDEVMSKENKPIFRGQLSEDMWDEINNLDAMSTGDDIRACIVSIVCQIQTLEHKLENDLTKLKPREEKIDD